MICPNCGEEIAEGMKFCGMCGTPVALTKKCISCGTEMPVRMKFCPECGTPQTVKKEVFSEPVKQESPTEDVDSEDDELLTVEIIEFEKIKEEFFNCSCDSKTLLAKIEKIYEAHRTNKKVLEVYLPLLADTKEGAERALDIAGSFNNDNLSVFLIAVDIGIELENLSIAEMFLNKAKKISQNNLLVICRECCLMLAMYKQYKTKSFLDNALALSKTISEAQTTETIEKSWQLRIMALIMNHNGEKAPCFDLNFCKENNLVYRIVAWMDAIKTSEELKAALDKALPGESLLLKPGTYKIDYSFEKPIVIKALGETIFTFRGKIIVKSDLVLSGIKLIGNDTGNTIDIVKSAKTSFENCIFDKCGIVASAQTVVNLASCEICNAENGIIVNDDAVITFREGIIHDIVNDGISLSSNIFGDSNSTKSKLEGLKISNCRGQGISLFDADVDITDCEVLSISGNGISSSHGELVEISNCKVHDIEGSGFIGDFSVITNCEAFGCKVLPELLQQYNEEIENYEECLKEAQCQCNTADLPFKSDGSVDYTRPCEGDEICVPPVPEKPYCAGFDIRGNSILENCKAYYNEDFGFKIQGDYNPTLKSCNSHNNRIGFSIHLSEYFDKYKSSSEQDKKEDVLFEKCKSSENQQEGFEIVGEKKLKDIFTVLYRECESYKCLSGFSKGVYYKLNKKYLKSRWIEWDEISLGNNCHIEYENCKSDDLDNKKKGIEIINAE